MHSFVIRVYERCWIIFDRTFAFLLVNISQISNCMSHLQQAAVISIYACSSFIIM